MPHEPARDPSEFYESEAALISELIFTEAGRGSRLATAASQLVIYGEGFREGSISAERVCYQAMCIYLEFRGDIQNDEAKSHLATLGHDFGSDAQLPSQQVEDLWNRAQALYSDD